MRGERGGRVGRVAEVLEALCTTRTGLTRQQVQDLVGYGDRAVRYWLHALEASGLAERTGGEGQGARDVRWYPGPVLRELGRRVA